LRKLAQEKGNPRCACGAEGRQRHADFKRNALQPKRPPVGGFAPQRVDCPYATKETPMTIARRKILGLLAAGATTALAACGGGGDYPTVPTRFLWVLNLHPEFTSTDVALGPDLLVSGLPFPGLTPRIEAEFGVYVLGLRDRPTGRTLNFSDFTIDALSPTINVFYRYGSSGRLGASPLGIVNYFESSESLIADLDDGNGNVQTSVLAFERAAAQVSGSANCRLRLSRASDGIVVYDSGLRQRTDAIVVFPADATVGLVGVVALNYTSADASVASWANVL